MSSNGRLNTRTLVLVGGKLFAASAAPYFEAMFEDMEDAGVGRPTVRHGYRDIATQVEMREEYGTGAAIVGTSNHGWGISADLASGPAPQWYALTRAQLAWLRKYAIRYGIVEDVPGESWHWTLKKTPTINLKERARMDAETRKKIDQIHAEIVGTNSDLFKTKAGVARTESRLVAILRKLVIKDPAA